LEELVKSATAELTTTLVQTELLNVINRLKAWLSTRQEELRLLSITMN